MNRSKIIIKNASLSLWYKALNMLIVFINIPILLNYLEKELYGIWVTIFSLITIFFFIDGGISNGLKTRLTEALSNKNFSLAKIYISTSYILISVLAFILLSISIVAIILIDVQELFNVSISNFELKKILIVTVVLISTNFILSLYKSFYYAKHQASKVELSMLIYQCTNLLSILVLIHVFPANLLYITLVHGVSNLITGLIFTIYFFKKNKNICPSFASFNKERVNDLLGLSLSFFVIQLCMIIIFSTDNILITRLLGPEEVAKYDVVLKLFQILITLSVILQDPLWAMYTDAYQKNKFDWIKNNIKRLNKLFILFIVVVVILFFISKPIIRFWTQQDFIISNSLLIFMSIFVLIRTYGIIYMNFINAIGKLQIQMWFYIIGALINIPLSIFFVKKFNLGSEGIILGTIISLLGLTIALPIQTVKILKSKKTDKNIFIKL